MEGVNCSLCFFSTVTMLHRAGHNYQYSVRLSLTSHAIVLQLTYTFVNVSSDADESVGQSTGAALLLWLIGGIVAEHSLNVETQQKTQETARLPLLRDTHTHKGQMTHLYFMHIYCLISIKKKVSDVRNRSMDLKQNTTTALGLTCTSFISDLSRSFTPISVSPAICHMKNRKDVG